MSSFNKILLTTAYLPPVEYFALMIANGNAAIEKWENYTKQSYRNRCHIYSANGLLSLNIPIDRSTGSGTIITNARIDYSTSWQIRHWRAIVSAYKSSPFFEYYQDDFYPFYHSKDWSTLYEFNKKLIELIVDLMGLKIDIRETDKFIKEVPYYDYRYKIHPKQNSLEVIKNGQYQQVFAHKFGFISNLSIVDLLFNEGPASIDYCKLKLESY